MIAIKIGGYMLFTSIGGWVFFKESSKGRVLPTLGIATERRAHDDLTSRAYLTGGHPIALVTAERLPNGRRDAWYGPCEAWHST